ncbi:MAG: hypothetical protein DWQ47_14340 [Acidobacteria bacterium]|nr:MAG: hypothetical protein DWQ32_01740 [Acidobacteriota bacterium]REK02752.1 MAG: hypothetical protein DWQ38_10395 [Acidobacteriota bacterium]REK13443.1 MAG: hypothetical protein DWQ43_07430 [Acidobacteriota bacterium]REK41437.1 MAG: hypothetical protein DWQ47_14340 [Acidobacteriota bacterium]
MQLDITLDRYSRCRHLLKWRLPNLPYLKPKVFISFLKWSGLKAKDGKDVLAWWKPTGPRIKVRSLQPKTGRHSGAVAHFLPHLGLIEIDTWVCEIVEKHHGNPKVPLLFEKMVMHELVHFGNHAPGTKMPQPAGSNDYHYAYGVERGMEFESEAYGVVQGWEEFGESKYTPLRL